MARRRQIYLVKCVDGKSGSGRPRQGTAGAAQLEPLGDLPDLVGRMARFNTAPDGAGSDGLGENPGMAILYGPGYTLEMPTTSDQVGQAIITLVDEDIAWSVLGRMCKEEGWMMMDPETGRTFGG